jgi:hypothetical protein
VLSCARLMPNLSISLWMRRSFLRRAPGVLRRDLCLMRPLASVSPARTSSADKEGSASEREDSGVAPSACSRRAFSRRLRFLRWVVVREEVEGFVMRETKDECLIRRLSRLDSIKDSETWAVGRWTFRGARGLARRSVAFARRVLRFVGAVGAFCVFSMAYLFRETFWASLSYHVGSLELGEGGEGFGRAVSGWLEGARYRVYVRQVRIGRAFFM